MTVPEKEPESSPGRVTLLQVIGSVLASFFGVQSSRNRARDFKHGRPEVFIAVGIIATAILILTLVLLVKLILRTRGM